MTTAISTRQRWRRALLLVSFLAFPITMNYLSPYLSVDGSFNGVLTGSVVAFGTMFLGSLLLGRLWCGWACPMAGLQEFALPINDKPVGRRARYVKWFIWVPWMAAIVFGALSVGGYRVIDLLYGTQGGISVAGAPDRPIFVAYIIYFGVIALFLGTAAAAGRRAGCHSICWMAPFMIGGRWIRNRIGWPSLRLVAEPEKCRDCGSCTKACPMGLDVEALVHAPSMEDAECVLCASCVDGCPQHVIRYSFSAGN
jgi:ferredoxin-type protein NapH